MSSPTEATGKDNPPKDQPTNQTHRLALPEAHSFPYMESISTGKKERAGNEEADLFRRLEIGLGQTSKEKVIDLQLSKYGLSSVEPMPDIGARICQADWLMAIKAEEELRQELVVKAREIASEKRK